MNRLIARLLPSERAVFECVDCGTAYDTRPSNCHACGGHDFTPRP